METFPRGLSNRTKVRARAISEFSAILAGDLHELPQIAPLKLKVRMRGGTNGVSPRWVDLSTNRPRLSCGAATTCSSSRLVPRLSSRRARRRAASVRHRPLRAGGEPPRGCITDRDVPRPDMSTTRRQTAAALTGGLIDGARIAMLNNVFSGSSDNVPRDVRQVLPERASIRSRRSAIRFRTSCFPWKGVWNPAAQGAQL